MLNNISIDTVSMGTPVTPSDGTGGDLLYAPPYSVEEFICIHVPKIDARRFLMMPAGEVFVVRAGPEDRQAAFAG